MIIDQVRALFEDAARARVTRGNPTGSRFGTCAAQSQMLFYPERYAQEPLRARALMTFEEGDRVEAWWGAQIDRAFPYLSGLQQEPFWLPVPLKGDEPARLEMMIRSRARWGTIHAGFTPPTIGEGADGRVKLRLAGNKRAGFVLDPMIGVVYAPTYVDRVIRHPEIGLAILEAKSMSNFAFRRAVLGDLDYRIRCQLAGQAAATGLPVCLLGYRKETAHLVELLYTPKADRTRVTITLLNGQAQTYDVETGGTLRQDGEIRTLPGDAEWELAETWTPFDAALLEQIRARIRRVLFFDGDPARLHREYGPVFTCPTCEGTGTQTLTKQTRAPLKKSKPCEDCVAGQRDEVELPAWPCGYCPVVQQCFGAAGVRLELDSRPHYYVGREAWAASGLGFTPADTAGTT